MDRTYSLTQKRSTSNVKDDKFKRKSDGYIIATETERTRSQPDKIQDFIKSTVCLKKEKTGLGISIIGGCDTHMGGVLISAINPKGAAGKDGRLKCGDQIVSVNSSDLADCSHEEAVQLLRLAKNPVRLTVYRENVEALFTNCNDPEKEFQVVLKKGINDNLGLGIYGRKDGKGIFVTYLAPGSLAEACGLIMQGDRILKCNGRDMRHASQQDAVNFLKNTFGEVRFLIGRTKNIEDVILGLLERINSNASSLHQSEEFKERKPRSRSDCLSVKSKTVELNKKPKARTLTVNEIYDASAGSTLDLLSNQPYDEIRYLNNFNLAYQQEVIHDDASKKAETELKSTLKKHGQRGARRKEHVSFEMSKIKEAKPNIYMYTAPENHSATNL